MTLYRSQSESFEEYDALPASADALSLGTARPGRQTRLQGDDAVTVHHSRTDPSTLAVPTLDGPVDLAGRPGAGGGATGGNGEGN